MADLSAYKLQARSVFEAVGGCRVEGPGVAFDEAPARVLVSLAAARGEVEALTATVEKATGLILPPGGRSATATFGGGPVTAIFSGPGQWLLSAERGDLPAELRDLAGGEGYVTDQSDGFIPLTLSGPAARDVLKRLSSLDFLDAAFPVGAAARTSMMQIDVIVLRLVDDDGAPRYHLETPRSTARDFAHDVSVAARALAAEAAL